MFQSMGRLLIAATMTLAVALLLAGTACEPANRSGIPPIDDWVNSATEDGRMIARFPVAPVPRTDTRPRPMGPIQMRSMHWTSGSRVMAISVTPIPAVAGELDVESGLENAARGAATSGTVLHEMQVEMDGCRGKLLVVSHPTRPWGIRTVLVIDPAGPALYQAFVSGSEDFVRGSDAEAFMASVTLKPR